MYPKIPFFFEARSLAPHLRAAEDPRFVPITLKSFFEACSHARSMRNAEDWNEYLLAHIHQTYLELHTTRGLVTVVDGITGRVNNVCWYTRYMELMTTLNRLYYRDVMAAIAHTHTLGLTVKHLRYVQHTDHYVMVEATCQHLLQHTPSP